MNDLKKRCYWFVFILIFSAAVAVSADESEDVIITFDDSWEDNPLTETDEEKLLPREAGGYPVVMGSAADNSRAENNANESPEESESSTVTEETEDDSGTAATYIFLGIAVVAMFLLLTRKGS